MFKQILIAFQFLTIIPLKVKGDISEKEISESASFFPVAGAFQGLLTAFAASLLIKLFSPEITAGLVILALIISNGGFHLDGLADTFDALAVKSSGNKDIDKSKRLSVMKDSSTGAIGMVAIVLVILMKFLFLKFLFMNSSQATCYSLLFLMPVFSKWAMVPAMYHGISARQDGLGRIFIDNIKVEYVLFSSLLTIIFCFLAVQFYLYKMYGINSILLFPVLFAILYLFSFSSAKFFIRRFDGLTGDNFGAVSEISEILFLMVISIWLQHFI